MLSLHTGYDTAYLTEAVGDGQAASDYYTAAAGEPPGYWQGAGAAALGLAGQVNGDVMRALYHEDTGPDGEILVRRQRPGNYTAAAGSLHQRIEAEVARQVAERGAFIQPEEIREIRLKERAKFRNRVPFYDYTFSAPKSVSVLWASLLQAAAEAAAEGREADAERLAEQAEQIRGAVTRANDRMIKVAGQRAAYVRTGHHSATSGEYRDAAGFIVGSFPQHTNREGDPQLHVHNAIANRAQRADGADEKWRALHGHPLFKEKLGFGTLADRFLAQELEQLGWRTYRRADGNALEIGGISEKAADAYSGRAKELRDKARELAADYEREHGHAPDKRAWFHIKQQAALKTRDSKDHNPPAAGQELATWAAKAERRGAGKLSSLHEAAAAYAAEHGPSELPGEAERARVIREAVAAVQKANPSWNRSQLIFELGRALPSLPPDVDPLAYLDELAGEAVSGRAEGVAAIRIAPVPDVVDTSRLEARRNGTSIYRPPGEERFVSGEHLDAEQHLAEVAVMPVRQRVTAEQAAGALAGTDLDYSQRAAAMGLLTSKRLINCLVAAAGTGKTHVMAAYAKAWTAAAAGRVIGLTASENAARVMAGEGMTETYNIARFLGKIKDSDETRGHVPVNAGDVLVVDEASQVSTTDLLRIVQAAEMSGATVVLVGDTEQLGSVDAGGMFRLIAARHGSWKLTEVRRFRHAWERDASLKLRDGDIGVLAEYDARGRIYHGPQDRVYDDAVRYWSTDFLTGKDTLLLAGTNEEAAHLARLARERLVRLGRVSGANEITLADGNQAGTGDLVRARLNTRIDADGQTLANRDTLRIEGFQDGAFERLAVASRKTGPGQWSRPFFIHAAYLQSSAELDYAGNVHVAQGRTVDTGHLVVSEGLTRDKVYAGATRGREKNTVHVVTGAADPSQPTREEREAYGREALRKIRALRLAGNDAAADAVPLRMPDRPSDRQMAPWEAVLAQALQRSDPEGTALETMQAAQDFTSHTGHLLELSEAFWRKDVVPKIDEMIRQRVAPREFERYMQDPERPALLQTLRAHEIGGRPIPDLLDSITARPFDGARSIAAALHGRAGKEPAPARGTTTTWAERAPREAPAEITAASEMLDARQEALGERVMANPPPWAVAAWGRPPAEPGPLRDDWQRRAARVESYREATGITDPDQATGPVPSGKAHLAEAFHASVRALQLPDEAALLRAMGRGELEARERTYIRASAIAPPDVQAQAGDLAHYAAEACARLEEAQAAGDNAAAETAEAEAGKHGRDLARLSVADAARREWLEAHAALGAQALAASKELRRRGLAERIPVSDTELAETSAQLREDPAMDPAKWAELKAAQTARLEADHAAQAEKMARTVPVTDAEIERYGQEPRPEPEAWPMTPERAQFEADMAEIRANIGREAEPSLAPETDPDLQRQAEEELWTPERARFEAEVAEIHARHGQDRVPEAEAETAADREARAGAELDAEPTRAAFLKDMAELRAGDERTRELVDAMPSREDEIRAQRDEIAAEPGIRPEAEAEAAIEPAWTPGTHSDQNEAGRETVAEADAEAEIEM